MALAVLKSMALYGLQGYLVQVEVDISPGLPAFEIVGLPDTAVREARERVRAAIRNSGFDFPARRITANLAPADLRKEGPSYDLALAVGILAATEQVPVENARRFVYKTRRGKTCLHKGGRIGHGGQVFVLQLTRVPDFQGKGGEKCGLER
nr:magnesium chelatase domain-containing protein [Ammonifex degensii]